MGAAPAAPMAADRLTADRLPPALLAECDARAAPFGAFDAPIARSVAALTAIGAFGADEFESVKMGFCDFARAGGPAAAASCAGDIILLDSQYAAEKQAFVLSATIAHEMKHFLQHRDARARLGADYCDSAQYRADKASMEAEADAFGDAVGRLLLLGRPAEIANECAVPLAVYLEPRDPATRESAPPVFQILAPHETARARVHALSARFLYYAETRPSAGKARVFENRSSPHRRFVEGRQVRLIETRLESAARSAGPFRLELSCGADNQ